MSKTVSVTERCQVDLRMQASSPFNHVVFNNPGTDLASPATFGVITASRGSGTRTITFGAKLRF